MIQKQDCFELGVVARTYSFKGELILHLDCDNPSDYYHIKKLFLEINKQLVPFFISKSTPAKAQQLRVSFDGIISEADAQMLLKKKIYLPLTDLPELADDQFYYHEIEGYLVVDNLTQKSGKVISVIENPGNTLIACDFDGKEALLPLNDSTFDRIDKNQKCIWLDIPEGLLAMYLD